ncbi:MAG: thioredoxin domain-containing protein [Gammaproteobacteria bacterium]|nr:thioredoxin domain-containing protein [Gammaproteobacteria bacterium]
MPNRLANESSPYLLQHADNPVDWYPWGEEAFALARESGRPILLSIGYSACHWCHVMAHESFEDEETARLMNKLFVNVKVDREERPDVDKIYQTAHQLITQRGGGWPLTMFLDGEDQRPFFGGTYFPKDARYGMPAFGDLLRKIAEHYAENRDDVRAQGERILEVFDRLRPAPAPGDVSLTDAPFATARATFEETLDREYGGFGAAPKFPHPTTIDRLLRHWRATAAGTEPDVEALFMVSLTLARMAEGGLFDHVGGGFYRYSVDRYWQIPHFEKMLYDNGPLLAIYAQAAIATGETLFAEAANATADWMLADMRDANGGFYATRDADSEGHEGLFYLWEPDEVRGLLGDDYAVFARRFGLDQPANFEGKWHLTVRAQVGSDELEAIDRARNVLLERRATRVPPDRDEKQLTAWNALAVRGLAIAGRSLQRPELVAAADDAIAFLRTRLVQDGRLLASYKDGQAKFAAYLDDHAFLLDALLEVLQARWDSEHLEFAIAIAELLLQHFEDREAGGFWFTADDSEQLMHRSKPFADEAVPSGNGIAAFALQRLGFLLGETRYLDAAERTLRAAWQAVDEYPHGHVSLLASLEEYLEHPEIVVIRGASDEIGRWRDSAAKVYAPRRLVFAIPADESGLPGALADRAAVDGDTIAYRCLGTHCEMPVTTWEALAAQLSDTPSA